MLLETWPLTCNDRAARRPSTEPFGSDSLAGQLAWLALPLLGRGTIRRGAVSLALAARQRRFVGVKGGRSPPRSDAVGALDAGGPVLNDRGRTGNGRGNALVPTWLMGFRVVGGGAAEPGAKRRPVAGRERSGRLACRAG